MSSNAEMYVGNLVAFVLQKLYYETHNVSFFKHYINFSIPLSSVNDAMLKSGNIVQILYHEFQPGTIKAAYSPMMDWINALYDRYFASEETFDEFLEKAGVYSLHKNIYIKYRENGVCQRKEEVIPVENEYEHQKFLYGIIGIFNYISEKVPLLIVLNKVHLAALSTYEFLYKAITDNPNNKMAIICTINEVFAVPDYIKTIRNDLMVALDDKNMIQDWGLEDKENVPDENDVFIPVSEDFDKYLVFINNMVESSAMAQAIYYCDVIEEALDGGTLKADEQSLHRFYRLYAEANFKSGNYPRTLTICDERRGIIHSDTSEEVVNLFNFEYSYLVSMCHSCAGQGTLAEKYAEDCSQFAYKTGDEYLIFKTELLKCMAKFRSWTNVYLWSVEFNPPKDFLENAEKFECYNHLAYIYLFCFGNDRSYYDVDPQFCESHDHYKKGMYFADMLGNEAIKLRAYKKNVVFSSGFGYYPAVDHFYKKSLVILRKQDNLAEMGNVYNGLGYNRIVSEQFNEADEYFNSAMEIWYKLGKPENMGESLYNMAVNAMLARDYQSGCDLLVTAVRIMKNLNQNKLELCNMSKIYGMLALCYIKLGVEYNAQLYINRMQLVLYHLIFPEGEPSYFLWDDDMFFYYFDRGLVARKDSLAEAQHNFDRASFHLKRTEGLWFFAYELFAVEQADLYRAQGRHVEANELLQDCLEFCTKNNYKDKIDRVNSALTGNALEEKHYNIGLKKVTVAQAIELSRRVGAEFQLILKNKSIDFLTNWQELMNRDDIKVKSLINTAMYSLQNNYNADRIIYLGVENGKADLIYCDRNFHPSPEVLQGIVTFFLRNPNEFMTNRLEKSFYEYKDLIGLFGINKVVSMIGVPILADGKLQSILVAFMEMHDNFANNFSLFLEGDLTIFSVAFHQLVDALNRLATQERIKKMNAQLEQTSVTDMLTGLYNRQGFAKTLREEMKKYESAPDVTTTVLYIDLDNFKFYNDTFGHAIGDVILVSFAEIFKQITKDKGYAIRYGGDEFVIVLTESSEEEGVEVAKSIYRRLDETDGFAERLKQKMGKDFKIDPKNRVSCSIGISTANVFSKEAIDEAMKQADDALYVVKKTTKRNYRVWKPDADNSR